MKYADLGSVSHRTMRDSDEGRRVIFALSVETANNVAVSDQFVADDDFRICRLSGGHSVRIDLVAFGAFCRARIDTEDCLAELQRLISVGNSE